jgi:hypothetical protein
MNRFDRVIQDIQQKTANAELKWVIVSPGRFERVLIEPDRVLRAAAADYDLGGKKFLLLFAEKKADYFDDFGGVREGRDFQLLILDQDGEIVLSFFDGVVDRDDLIKLAALIDDHNDRAREFFAAF